MKKSIIMGLVGLMFLVDTQSFAKERQSNKVTPYSIICENRTLAIKDVGCNINNQQEEIYSNEKELIAINLNENFQKYTNDKKSLTLASFYKTDISELIRKEPHHITFVDPKGIKKNYYFTGIFTPTNTEFIYEGDIIDNFIMGKAGDYIAFLTSNEKGRNPKLYIYGGMNEAQKKGEK